MKTNYHTHNQRCKHAFGSVADYAKEGYKAGFDILGMSDHCPFPDRLFGCRMDFCEFEDYIDDVRNLATQYRGKMDIKLGVEIEYIPDEEKFYNDLHERYNLDYLILGQHFYDNKKGGIGYIFDAKSTSEYVDYAKSIKDALKTGYFAFVAHPDIMFIHDFEWDDNCEKACDIIVDAALKYNTPLELNGNGVRRGWGVYKDMERYPYPHPKFFEMVSKARIPVMVNADCHQPHELDDEAMRTARQLISDWNLVYKDVL